MKTTLKDYRDLQETMKNQFAVKVIDNFAKELFLELTGEFNTKEDYFEAEASEFLQYLEFEGEPHGELDFDYVIGFGDMDACLRIQWITSCTYAGEDGDIWAENVEHDIKSIIFDLWGMEFDMSNDKDAIKIVLSAIDYNKE